MANYIQLSIDARAAEQEILISVLSDLGANGFEQTETNLLAYFDEAGFPSYEVNDVLKNYPVNLHTIPQQNWNAVWESNFQPVVVHDFCAVRAPFHPPIPGVQHEIVIMPKMSFGTGHHATTWMMMAQMAQMDFRGKKVFDFGTGTGILAILAEMRGAASVTAIDNDEWSIENGLENIQRNGCSVIDLALASSVPQATFDIILANINRNVILMHLSNLVQAVADGGYILFSGLLSEDEQTIVEACIPFGLTLVNKQDRNNWISLLLQMSETRHGI